MKKCLISLMLALSFLTACEKDYETSKEDELDYAFVRGDCAYVISALDGLELEKGSREEKMYLASLMECSGSTLFSVITNLDSASSGGDYYSLLSSILNVQSLTKDNLASLRENYKKLAETCKKAIGSDGKFADSSIALTCAMGESNAASIELFGVLTELNNEPIELSEAGIKAALLGHSDDDISQAIDSYFGLTGGEKENDKTDHLNDIIDNLEASFNDSIISDTLNINTSVISDKIDKARGSSGKVNADSILNFLKESK